ncbi:3-hydroxyacyl-CoA dehydrogenase [Nocardia stercoris]|uniref:3-hydroxyacyl-CoA dehydrogenase n=1 Tax=Nocardia stercoris TaxID=2483361 RepID=A0A3M2LA34_9NOCA|nr:3-hydroxyacyl-CoA dehydrogenase [Nocardia stercoris]RMI34274.1 3-hydroxyacyl-CoA dehydrogenase [Nocardia stercoris]
MTIQKVTVLGTGVLGSQIAFHTAFSGFDVTAYDLDEDALKAAADRFAGLTKAYCAEVPEAADGKAEKAAAAIALSCDLEEAVRAADLVIEAVPEVLAVKQDVYRRIGEFAPAHTIFATNSSTLLPSAIADSTGRPDRFLALHFANRIWRHNILEVMGTPATDPQVYRTAVEFAVRIGMVPIELHKEKSGYVLNSLLVPLLNAAMVLAEGGFADPETVDNTWRIGTGAPVGPFQILDTIGLATPYNILSHGGPAEQRLAAWIKENYLDQGKLGLASGEGFYRYT